MFHNLYSYRRYILRNAWYELHFRYAGTGLGIFWNVVHPVCEIIVYTVVFSLLISRGDRGDSFALYLMSGLLPWRTFVDALVQGGNAFSQNSRYLKRLAIPAEIFIAKVTVTSLMLLLIYLVLIVPLSFVFGGQLGWGLLLLPLLAVLLQGLGFGMQLGLANLQTLFPDVQQILQFLVPLWSWTMPIFYPSSIIPEPIQPLLYLSPPYAFIESIRNILLENRIPTLQVWGIMMAWISFFLWLGVTINHQLQDEVRDVL